MYKQYGEWRFTYPFDNKREAEIHIQLYLDRTEKPEITEIRFVPMTEEWIESLERREKIHG